MKLCTPQLRRILAAGLFALMLCGCENDESCSPAGTWAVSGVTVIRADGSRVEKPTAPVWTERLIINPDGTFTYASTFGSSSAGNGTWIMQDNVIAFSGSRKQFACRISGDSMIFSGSVPEGCYELRWVRQ